MTHIKLVVFDWAGTTVDHGSMAPLAAFLKAFAERGVRLTPAQARAPMGQEKGAHLRALLADPDVARAWRQAHGRDYDEADVLGLYHRFTALQLEEIDQHARLTPHVLETAAALRQQGIHLGATTGYFRAAAERLYAAARAQGFSPDACACADDVPSGRPAPWMVFRVMEMLNVYPPAAVVKVGDTVPDVGEGLAAGAWSVAVLRTGSEVGVTEAEWAALPEADRRSRLGAARQKLLDAGAHAVLETLAELPALVAEIGERLGRGEKP
jgi:phosphonoacetaldehyde hydrolase